MDRIDLNGARVLVTGGAGVIGRELLNCLGRRGADVLSIDRLPLASGAPKGARHVELDLAVDSLDPIRQFRPQLIFHLAAAFERSMETPGFWTSNWSDNVLESHRVIDVMREMDSVEVFVFASSYLLYSPELYFSDQPHSVVLPLQEGSPISPRNLCGASKLYTERELEFFTDLLDPGLRTVLARIYRVYGLGSEDVVSRWVNAALRCESIEVYNSQNRFDYIFAGDVAEGLARLGEAKRAKGPVNLGTGSARSVSELLAILCEQFPGFSARVKDRGATEDFEASCADVSLLEELIGWVPPTTLESGVRLLRQHYESTLVRT